jgi:D-threo-aldose 1-dehydrogenase
LEVPQLKLVQLSNSNRSVSRFIFGTAKLFSLSSQRERRRLLELAIEHGFTHFDTAPLYGFGIAETDLGFVLKKHQNVGISTKVGIYAPGGENQSPSKVFLRKSVGKVLRSLSAAQVDFSLQRAKGSLDASLKRLGRDQIELYFIHEPDLELLATDEWLGWLEESKKSGKILEFGLAGEVERILPIFREEPRLASIIQTLDNLIPEHATKFDAFGRFPQITYGYFSSNKASAPQRTYSEILTSALERNRNGAIIVSTGNPSHLSIFSELSDAEQ